MTLFAWLIASLVFSCIGTGGLLLLRRFVRQPLLMRSLIWLVVWLSLLLPGLFEPFPSHAHHTATGTATTVGEFCHCQAPNTGDVIRFQANLFYDFLLLHHNLLTGLWLVPGLLILAGFTLRSGRTLYRFRKSTPEKIRTGGRHVRLHRDIEGLPVGAIGMFRKRIHWHSSLDALPEPCREAILAHERTHLRQLHTFEKIAAAILNTVWWMNPAWHILRRELALQAEYAADEAAVKSLGDRKLYASLLLHLQTKRQPGLLLTFSKSSTTGKRIRHLLREKRGSIFRPLLAAATFLVILTCGDASAGTLIQKEWENVEVYKVVNRTHAVTGKTEFCKSCAFDNAASECYEQE